MDVKVTMSFNAEIIEKAKKFAAEHNISLSRLTEFLYSRITTGNYKTLEDIPVADWVMKVAEGDALYITKQKKRNLRNKEYFNSRK
ncbi:MAG: DUF6364 family protein [Chitinophagales bacterium]